MFKTVDAFLLPFSRFPTGFVNPESIILNTEFRIPYYECFIAVEYGLLFILIFPFSNKNAYRYGEWSLCFFLAFFIYIGDFSVGKVGGGTKRERNMWRVCVKNTRKEDRFWKGGREEGR